MSARLDRSGADALTTFSDTRPLPNRSRSSSVHGEAAKPAVPPGLVEALRLTFPLHVSAQNELRDYDRMVGQQEVINYLASLHERETL